MSLSSITHLQFLESEAIFILRETAAQFQKPALLFSGGKDSIVMAWLARKAFYPAKLPFPLLHVDTGHNFPEAMTYRDWFVNEIGAQLIVGSVQKSIDDGRVQEEKGINASRNKLQTVTLLDTIEEQQFDAALGGGRRDEEKARAKERIFSFRDDFGQWEPRNQRPELWNVYNARIRRGTDAGGGGEHIRVFPLSNWTELDVWQYIEQEKIELPSIYFSHSRDVVMRSGQICPISDFFPLREGEVAVRKTVRFRTVGDMTCTAGVESPAASVRDIIDEIAAARTSERGARLDDTFSEAAMEDRKREGYF
jgi:sulfate adenylyltransferase subunit 2